MTLLQHADALEAIFASMRDADDLNLAYHPIRTLSHGDAYGPLIEKRKAARRDGQIWFVANDLESRHPEISKLLSSHMQAASGSKPTQKWMKALSGLITADLRDDLAALVVAMTEATFPDNGCWYDDRMKGLLWAAALCEPEAVAPAVTRFAGYVCYRSFPGAGVNNEALGNACVVALASMPDGAGIRYLSRLLAGVKFPKIKQRLATALDEAAAKAGMTRGELEEISVPTHDLSAEGKLEWPVGGGAALIALDGATSVALSWRTPDGAVVKSLPAALKNAADEVKAIRARIKEIEADLSVLPWRIQRLWLEDRRWTPDAWRQCYVEHPLAGLASRRLVWNAHIDGRRISGLWSNGAFVGLDGQPIPLDRVLVSLWHPVGCEVAEVMAWRARLAALGIVQPFKQAHREVYLVTEAERRTGAYSNRFAGHIVKQQQMMALARLNGWAMTAHTGFDGGKGKYPSRIALPRAGLIAEYWLEGVGGDNDFTPNGAHLYLATDQLRFVRPNDMVKASRSLGAPSGNIDGVAVRVEEVPPLLLSEIMRHCDLFVGVASIANDPDWIDAGTDIRAGHWRQRANEYWRGRSFGDIGLAGETRRDLLRALLPCLALGKVSRIEGNFLRVEGKLRAYKIHLELRQHLDGAGRPIPVHRAKAGRRQEADRLALRRR